jgi:hypothetical protein
MIQGAARVTIRLRFADTDNRNETRRMRRRHLIADLGIVLAVIGPPL